MLPRINCCSGRPGLEPGNWTADQGESSAFWVTRLHVLWTQQMLEPLETSFNSVAVNSCSQRSFWNIVVAAAADVCKKRRDQFDL